MKRVLVTGGSGFIGSHVVDRLSMTGWAPRIYDLRPSPHHAPGLVDTVVADLLDPDALRRAMRDCDAIIHLAASADVGIVAREPVEAEQANARGTLAVLEAAREVGVGRVVYGSTIWVYGASGDGVIDEGSPIGLPPHLYTATKLAGEMYCASYAELYGVQYTILRFGIPYGPRARPSAVIPIFVRKALEGEPLTLAGDGGQTRRFVYVEDLAEGIVRGLAPRAANRVYNLASDETVTIRELAETVDELVGDVEIVHTPARAGDFGGAEVSSARAAEELGWSAHTPLHEGIGRYLAWVREQDALAAAERAAAPEPALGRARLAAASLVSVGALSLAVGTMVPYILHLGQTASEHEGAHVPSLMITAACAIVIAFFSFSVIPARAARTASIAGWTLAIYLALDLIPWSRVAFALVTPRAESLVYAGLGVVLTAAVLAASGRVRAELRAQADRAG